MYMVMCSLGPSDDITHDPLEAEFSGIVYDSMERARQELIEALEHPAVYSAWIVEQ